MPRWRCFVRVTALRQSTVYRRRRGRCFERYLSTHLNLDPALIRILLRDGANTNVLRIRKIPKSKIVTELLRLLAEYRYDFKPDGRRILQSVVSPGCYHRTS